MGEMDRHQLYQLQASGFALYLISTITNRGKLCFKVFKQRFDTTIMLDFLRRLVRHSAQKVFLIVDGHPVHRARAVQRAC